MPAPLFVLVREETFKQVGCADGYMFETRGGIRVACKHDKWQGNVMNELSIYGLKVEVNEETHGRRRRIWVLGQG